MTRETFEKLPSLCDPSSEFSFDMDGVKITNEQFIDEESGYVWQMSTVELDEGYI